MAIDKELFYASHGLKYPVVARQYTDDIIVKKKIYTKDEVIAMYIELQAEIEEIDSRAGYDGNGMPTFSTDYIRKKKVNEVIQQKIGALKGEEE